MRNRLLDKFLSDLIPGYAALAEKSHSDSDLETYFRDIDQHKNKLREDDIINGDVYACTTKYLYALRALVASATESITIFTDGLPVWASDGTPLYGDREIIMLFMAFLKNGGRITILTRSPVDNEFISNHPCLKEAIKYDLVRLYVSTDRAVRTSASKWLVADGRGFNFRYDRFSLINFNNPTRAQRLEETVQEVIRRPTTYLLDPRLVYELASAA